MPKLDKTLSIALVVAILIALGGIVYFATTHQPNEKFTEFYILGPEGKAENYPQQVILGDSVDIIIGMANHEYQPAAYQVMITINGTLCKEVDIGTLSHGQKWEREVGFITQTPGNGQRVEFWLYRDGGAEPYLDDPLRLCIDVTEPK